MIKGDLRSCLHLLQPSLQETVKKKQWKLMETKSGAAVRDFRVGDTIMVRDYSPTAKARWTQGVVEAKYGSKTYVVWVECG